MGYHTGNAGRMQRRSVLIPIFPKEDMDSHYGYACIRRVLKEADGRKYMGEYEKLKSRLEQLKFVHFTDDIKEELRSLARPVMNGFLFAGIRISNKDKDTTGKEMLENVKAIFNGDEGRRVQQDAFDNLFEFRDIEAFLLPLCFLATKIFYEGYGSYWLSHCRPVSVRDNDTEFTYYNDIISMYWSGEWQEWKTKGKYEVTIMLPPTSGLMMAAYKDEIEKLGYQCKRVKQP